MNTDAFSNETISLGQLKDTITATYSPSESSDAADFLRRFDQYAPDALALFGSLYGDRGDFNEAVEAIFMTAARANKRRKSALKERDAEREFNGRWYQDHQHVGGVCYVDLFAGDLKGLKAKIPYFKELGLTYLHLMPLYGVPDGPNDGGYAVTSYRRTAPGLGAMKDLRSLADDLRKNDINLVLDFVFNHTAADHEWALKALTGDPKYRDFYFFFPDRELPDAYDATLREIFPDEHPGAFTYLEESDEWVWTTFHSYQWDLNYRNPEVFRAMLEELLFLANVGADVIRLDAVVFIWKQLGTNCENLPQTHTIIQALNAFVRMAAPAMAFKSEAIVHPDDVVQFFGTGDMAGRECELSYHPLLMVELWEALATGYTHLLNYSMKTRFETIPKKCAWVNYVRCHDDIGWGFADEDASALHINGFNHRLFLNRFYTGAEHDSFARGWPFQFNPKNMDMRISGTAASLAGLEAALETGNPLLVELALRRHLLIHSVIFTMGGIPLLYLGDEVAQLNDYSYLDDPALEDDSRWVHRGEMDWGRADLRYDPESIPGRVFNAIARMSHVRKMHPAFGSRSRTRILDIGSQHVYAYTKSSGPDRITCVANFTAEGQGFNRWALPGFEVWKTYEDIFTGDFYHGHDDWSLGPYEFRWLRSRK